MITPNRTVYSFCSIGIRYKWKFFSKLALKGLCRIISFFITFQEINEPGVKIVVYKDGTQKEFRPEAGKI